MCIYTLAYILYSVGELLQLLRIIEILGYFVLFIRLLSAVIQSLFTHYVIHQFTCLFNKCKCIPFTCMHVLTIYTSIGQVSLE